MAEIIPFAPTLVRRMAEASSDDARLIACSVAAVISVRAGGAATARLARALGVPALPTPNAVVTTSCGDCLWVRPDEWLLAGASASREQMCEVLDTAVGNDEGAVVDVSASRIVLELSGPASRDVLAGCCPLDLHPSAFLVGRCAQSVIAKAPVLLHLANDTPCWRIYLRPSLAAYVVAWLTDAMHPA